MVNRKSPNDVLADLADTDAVEYLRELRRITSRLIAEGRSARDHVPLSRLAVELTERIAEVENAGSGGGA